MADNYLLLKGASGETVKVKLVDLKDGTFALKTETDVAINVEAVTATNVTIKDADEADNKLKINEDGSVNAQLVGAIPEYNWFAGEERPEPAEPAKPAIGVEVDAETGDMVGLLWNGEDWEEV